MFDSPRPRRAAAAGLFLGTLLLGGAVYRGWFRGGQAYEFCQYGEIAANLLEGKGYATATYYPCTLAFLAARGIRVGDTGPQVDRFPLQVALVALMEVLFGRKDAAVAAANILAHAAWVALLFWGGSSLFGPAAGLAAAALWALDPMLLVGFDLYGYPDVLFGALFLGLNLVFFEWLESPAPRRAAAAGVLAGLCYLARYSFGMMLPAYLSAPLWSAAARRNVKDLGLFAASFLALALPWSLFNRFTLGGGSPPLLLWNLAMHTIVPGLPWAEYRVFTFSDFASQAALASLGRKWLVYFAQFLKDWPRFWFSLPLFPFAAVALWKLPPSPGRRLLRFYAALLLWTAACFSFLRYEDLGLMNGRYYLWCGSALVLAATACVEHVVRERWPRFVMRTRFGLLASMGVLWLIVWMRLPDPLDHASRLPVGEWPEVRYVREHPVKGWLVTNMPTQLTWYAGQKTITLPNTPPGVGAIARDYDVGAVYISFHRVGEMGNYPAWKALLGGYAGGVERFCRELGFEVERSDESGILLRKSSLPPP